MDPWTILRALPPVTDLPGAEYAVLVPLYEDARREVRVVLTKRPDDMPTHPNDIVFPGGHREDGEEPISTALREAWEEVGLPRDNVVEILGGLTPVTMRDRTRPIVPVVVKIERPVAFIPDHREVDVIIEPTIAELLDEDRWETRS
jgi:8-oxo-dGTP pyrophosphatase MutT (NUDIX family)